MRSVVMFELVALLLLPVVLGYLRKRRLVSTNLTAIMLATLLSLVMGTMVLSLRDAASPPGLFMRDWPRALAVAAFFWLLGFPLARWLLHALFGD